MATKKRVRSAADDERRGRSRFVDQPGQWVDRTPSAVKKRQAKDWGKLDEMMKKKTKKKNRGIGL